MEAVKFNHGAGDVAINCARRGYLQATPRKQKQPVFARSTMVLEALELLKTMRDVHISTSTSTTCVRELEEAF